MEKVNICKSVLTVMSVLTFQRLTKEEMEAEHKNMDDLIEAMDRQRIPWRLQNALFYIGAHYDVRVWYLDQLLHMAQQRAGVEV